MKKSSGFTFIELMVVAVLFLSMSGLFLYQKSVAEAASRDDRRRADINTLYHNLEKVYYAKHKSYPATLDAKSLSALPKDAFKDPSGITINGSRVDNELLGSTTQSTYTYEPTGCKNNQCSGYTLRADLEREDDYTRTSQHKK